MLRSRLQYATLKAERGWKSFSLNEEEGILNLERKYAMDTHYVERKAHQSTTFRSLRQSVWESSTLNAPPSSAFYLSTKGCTRRPSKSTVVSRTLSESAEKSCSEQDGRIQPSSICTQSCISLVDTQQQQQQQQQCSSKGTRPRRASLPTLFSPSTRYPMDEDKVECEAWRGISVVDRRAGQAAVQTTMTAKARAGLAYPILDTNISKRAARRRSARRPSLQLTSSLNAGSTHTAGEITSPVSPTTEEAARVMMLLASSERDASPPM
jgi:hypothetical protein